MLISKIFIGCLLIPLAGFSGTNSEEIENSDSFEMITYYEGKVFCQMQDQIDRIVAITPSERNFGNTIGAFIKALSTLHNNFSTLKKLIPSQIEENEIKQHIRDNFKNFLRENILTNDKLILVLEQYGQTALNQESTIDSHRNLIVTMLESSFPLFVSNILQRNPSIQPEIKDYLLLCKEEESKTKVYVEGNVNSEGEKYVTGGIKRQQENEDGSRYSVDFNGKIQQDKNGKTKTEVSTRIEMDF